jgi:hypothetical protein
MKKSDILWQADYRYNFDRDLWVNPKAKKAFSVEFVDDKPEGEIVRHIEEGTNDSGWTFYFNMAPSDGVKRALEQVLG